MEEAEAVRAPFTGSAPARRDPDRGALPAAGRAAPRPRDVPGPGPPGARGADVLAAGGARRPGGSICCCSPCRSACPVSPNSPCSTRTSCSSRRTTTGSAGRDGHPARGAARAAICCCSTRGTACATRRWTSAARPAARTGRPVTTTAAGPVHAGPAGRGRARCDAAAAHRARGWRPAATSQLLPGASRTRRRPGASRSPCGRAPRGSAEFEELGRGAARGGAGAAGAGGVRDLAVQALTPALTGPGRSSDHPCAGRPAASCATAAAG